MRHRVHLKPVASGARRRGQVVEYGPPPSPAVLDCFKGLIDPAPKRHDAHPNPSNIRSTSTSTDTDAQPKTIAARWRWRSRGGFISIGGASRRRNSSQRRRRRRRPPRRGLRAAAARWIREAAGAASGGQGREVPACNHDSRAVKVKGPRFGFVGCAPNRSSAAVSDAYLRTNTHPSIPSPGAPRPRRCGGWRPWCRRPWGSWPRIRPRPCGAARGSSSSAGPRTRSFDGCIIGCRGVLAASTYSHTSVSPAPFSRIYPASGPWR